MVQINKLHRWLETGIDVVDTWNYFLSHKHFWIKVRWYSNLAFRTWVWYASLSAAIQDTDLKKNLLAKQNISYYKKLLTMIMQSHYKK